MGSLDFNDYNFDNILEDIASERIRQDAKFGRNRALTPTEWLPALIEEVGEFAREICDDNDYHENMRAELVQIAALTVAIIQDLDRQCDVSEEW